jgi:peptidylprolyl isomerase
MSNPPGTRNAKRAAAKEHRRAAAAAAAARRKRQQAMLGAIAGLAVAGVIVAVFLLVRGGGGDSTASTPSAAPSAGASAAPSAAAFPPLPAGADPALASKPSVGPGTGQLTVLKVTPIIEGTGPGAQNGQTVTVNYVGATYKDGKEFDASWTRKQTLPVTLGSGGVIKGWDQGLVGAKVGSRIQLDIPAALAYGDPAPAGYPSGALRFVIDVLAVQ